MFSFLPISMLYSGRLDGFVSLSAWDNKDLIGKFRGFHHIKVVALSAWAYCTIGKMLSWTILLQRLLVFHASIDALCTIAKIRCCIFAVSMMLAVVSKVSTNTVCPGSLCPFKTKRCLVHLSYLKQYIHNNALYYNYPVSGTLVLISFLHLIPWLPSIASYFGILPWG